MYRPNIPAPSLCIADSGPEPFVDVDPTLLLEIEKHVTRLLGVVCF